jgi:hypothetical protein
VTEAVDALVGDELGLPDFSAGAEPARGGAELVVFDAEERPLENSVVVARRAAGAAGDKRLADVAVEV